MILCAIDDLFFSIKISTAAKQLGVDVFFERSADHVVDRVREKRPSLVILDLNSAKLNQLATLTAMKTDPALRDIPTLGYVAHIDSATIDAARAAGVDQVLARSAFVEKLREILTTGA
jgi:CheY-like chemotaxis protein